MKSLPGLIQGAIEALLGTLITWTGKKVLSLCGLSSNELVEGLIGLIVWAIATVLVIMLIVWIGSHAAKP